MSIGGEEELVKMPLSFDWTVEMGRRFRALLTKQADEDGCLVNSNALNRVHGLAS